MPKKRHATDTRDMDPPVGRPADEVADSFVLRRSVQVAAGPNEPLVTLEAGTAAGDIPADQLAQLCAEHFTEGA